MNKHLVALGCAVAAWGIHLFFSYRAPGGLNFERGYESVGFALLMASVVACLALILEISQHKADELGILKEERQSLIGYLSFSLLLSITAIVILFNRIPTAHAAEDAHAWFYHEWGTPPDCSNPFHVRPNPDNSQELFLEIGGERHVRQIIGQPTRDTVRTDLGTYRLLPDGGMTTSESGIQDPRLIRCDR